MCHLAKAKSHAYPELEVEVNHTNVTYVDSQCICMENRS